MFTDRILHNSAKPRWLVPFRSGENWDWGSIPLGSLCPAYSRSFRPTLTTVNSWTPGRKACGFRMSHSHLTGVSPKRPNPVEGNSQNFAGPEGPKEVPPLILKVPRGPPTRILPPSGHRDEGTEMPALCSRDSAPLPVGPPAPPAEAGSKSGPC